MFWGLVLEPHKRYSQTVEKSFHVSMATLNVSTAEDKLVQVMLHYEDTRYLLCNLKKSSTWQVPLDLNFQEGTTISFVCHGQGQVHLSGYLIHNDFDELEDEENDEEGEDEEEEEDDDEAPTLVTKQAKRKPKDSLKNENKAKRLKQEVKADSSDEDVELDGTAEENDTDEENSEEEDEESSNEEEDEDDDEEEKKVKPQEKKKEEKKLVNGKEVKQKKNKGENNQAQQNVQNEQKKKVVEGGVQIEEVKVGNGPFAKSGKFISVYYVGRLKNGKKFDATTQGEGFKFRLGKGEVIKGWDVGIIGMKVGGKRRITVPPAMAYGAKGSPPVIPGNSTLIFEVELRDVY